MKYYLILLSVFLTLNTIAQNKTGRKPKKNNIKISLLEYRNNSFYSPFKIYSSQTFTSLQNFGVQYERVISSRHKFIATPRFTQEKYIYRGTVFSIRDSYELGLGYRYYFLKFKKNDFFNGAYAGVSFFANATHTTDRRNDELSAYHYALVRGSDFELGTQTKIFKRFSLQLSGSYRVSELILPNLPFQPRPIFLTSISLGYSF